MDRKIIFGVLLFAFFASIAGLLIPADRSPPVQTFPWQVESMPDGATKVFKLIPGKSTLQQAEHVFGTATQLSLFEPAPGKGQRKVEAYFDKVNLGGLSASVVVVLVLTQDQLQTMFERGVRISTLGDGSRKVTLHTDDVAQVRTAPIYTITYLPKISLNKELLEKRFGNTYQIVMEKGSNTRHWLYPHLGLDISLDENNHAVLQYIAPANFDQLLMPLK